MSENAENANVAEESVVDSILGGDDSHSPEVDTQTTAAPEADHSENGTEGTTPEGDAAPAAKPDDSATPEETESDSKLKQELETLQKRFKDTQSALHRATTERSELRKELEALKAKEEDENDWFGDEDRTRKEELENKLTESDAQTEKLNQEAALLAWDTAAAPVIAAHPDFEDVVYGKLAPRLDAEKGDPEVIRLWNAESDQSPANAYKFAKELDDRLLAARNPQAYRDRIRKEVEEEIKNRKPSEVTGKSGLDLMNSADTADTGYDPGGESAVDFVLKE